MAEENSQFTTQTQLLDQPMMTEEEAQEIIHSYNRTIETLHLENATIQTKLNEAQNQMIEFQSKQSKLQELVNGESFKENQIQIQELQFNERLKKLFQNPLLKDNEVIIQGLMRKCKNQEKTAQKTHIDSDEEEEQIIQFDQNEDISFDGQEETSLENTLKQTLKELEALVNQTNQRSKYKFCMQCHQNFIPQLNQMNSCLFHPGKMKFYSCRRCGADEYFNCCMKCSKCSTGCRYSSHLPKP